MSMEVYKSKEVYPLHLVKKCKKRIRTAEEVQEMGVRESRLPSGSQAVKWPFLSPDFTH